MFVKVSAVTAAIVTAISIIGVAPSALAASQPTLPVMDPAGPQFTEAAGATPLATSRTVPHWSGSYTDPSNGVTYGYNMVGAADPRSSNGTTTVPTDVIPIDVVFAANNGFALNGTDVQQRTVNSPIFQPADYTTTAKATGGAGALSAGNSGVQYEDAVMRSQFDKTASRFHLNLGQPAVGAAVTFTVPQGKGSAYQNSRGVVYGLVDYNWFSSRIQELMGQLHTDAAHLPIFLTNNVMLYIGTTSNCCVIGYHGASKATGHGLGNTNGNGNESVQTFAFAAYTTPGTFASYFVRDIHALSHEIAEWGDDPFVNNVVNPWLTPTAPQYGCTNVMETGDPVVGIGFTLPGNTYDVGAITDGAWHPEDEVFLPWFARQNPNTTSQMLQNAPTGRYTFMGDLNPYPGFQQPAKGC